MTTMTHLTLSTRSPSAFVERTVDLRTGVRLAYVEQGDPHGLPVVFLHGLSDSWRSFEPVLPRLPATIRALVPSQRGHGNSGHPDRGYGPHDFSEDVAAFLDALGIDSAVIVGHSMGTTIAQRVALDHPGRVIALALIGGIFRWRGNAALEELHADTVALTDPVDPDFAREFQLSTVVQPVPMTFIDMAVEESLKLPARVWKAMLNEFMDDDFSDRLGDILVPTALIWGDRDPLFSRADEEAIIAAVPGSRLIEHTGTGHAVHWEQPARAASDVVAFVGSLVSSLLETEAA
jgi:pimeloyl-ACP methyl ester carboxylesterase